MRRPAALTLRKAIPVVAAAVAAVMFGAANPAAGEPFAYKHFPSAEQQACGDATRLAARRMSQHPEVCDNWAELAVDVFGARQAGVALCVIAFESSGDPDRIAETVPGGTVGLMQIAADNWAGRNRVHGLRNWPTVTISQARDWLTSPSLNLWAAKAMVDASGWLPAWNAQRHNCDLS